MNFGELKTAVLDFATRPDLTAEVPRFVALAEGLIRRDLLAMPLSVELTDTDRVSEGVYSLPAEAVQVRAVTGTRSGGEYTLKQVSLEEIKRLTSTAPALNWCALGGSQIEFRGVPSSSEEFTVRYLGHPAALEDDADENDLLTNHEALYLYGSLFHLYQFTQDPELAQGALDTFKNALERLNARTSRELGGARVATTYNFGPTGRYGY